MHLRMSMVIGSGQAKIKLFGADGAPEIVFSVGIKRSDLRRVLAEVGERREQLQRQWEAIHGAED